MTDQPSNVTNINPLHNDVVDALEGLLERAQRGGLSAFFASYVEGEDVESTVHSIRAGSFPPALALTTLIGSLEDHKMALLDRLRYLEVESLEDDDPSA